MKMFIKIALLTILMIVLITPIVSAGTITGVIKCGKSTIPNTFLPGVKVMNGLGYTVVTDKFGRFVMSGVSGIIKLYIYSDSHTTITTGVGNGMWYAVDGIGMGENEYVDLGVITMSHSTGGLFVQNFDHSALESPPSSLTPPTGKTIIDCTDTENCGGRQNGAVSYDISISNPAYASWDAIIDAGFTSQFEDYVASPTIDDNILFSCNATRDSTCIPIDIPSTE